jgi:hypothetical protein
MTEFEASARQSFTVPVTSGQYAPEVITVSRTGRGVTDLSALIEQAVANAVLELWLLKIGGDPTQSADYFYSAFSVATGHDGYASAPWPAAQWRAKSGGTAGTLIANTAAS